VLNETKRLIREGHAALLQVVRYTDDSAGDAFNTFRKGVVRADSTSQPTLLRDLEQKPKVLMKLAEFAQSRRPHRRQIAHVLGILLKESTWREDAKGCSFMDSLPHEMREDVSLLLKSHSGQEPGPSASQASGAPATTGEQTGDSAARKKGQSEALMSVIEGMQVLRQLDFEMLREDQEPEAQVTLREIADGLNLVVQFRPEELQAIARLEPKLSFLRFLYMAHGRFPPQREQVLEVLRHLLETPQLLAWRQAADSDQELQACLSTLRPSTLSPNTSEDERAHASANCHARWMWRDAGRGYGGPIGAQLARRNPVRWSQLLPLEYIIEELIGHLGTSSEEKAVRLEILDEGTKKKMEAENIREAVSKLQEHAEGSG